MPLMLHVHHIGPRKPAMKLDPILVHEVWDPNRHQDVPSTTIPTDSIEINPRGAVRINGICATVVCYRILVENKVMIVEFADGRYEKMVLQDGDKFDIDTGIRIAIAKHVGRKVYNRAGIEYLAFKLSHLQVIDKMIHKAHVEYRRREKEQKKSVPKVKSKKRKATAVADKPARSERPKRRSKDKTLSGRGIKITKSPHKDATP